MNKIKTYLINDDELFNYKIQATSYRQAIAIFKDLFSFSGRLRLTAHYANVKEYKLVYSTYKFSITEIL
jgi:hypothetical protein